MNTLPKKDYVFLYAVFYTYVITIVLYCTMVNFKSHNYLFSISCKLINEWNHFCLIFIIQCLGQYLLNRPLINIYE